MSSAIDKFVRPELSFFGPNGQLSWDVYESFKGLLILLIVMGHNSMLTSAIPELDVVLYNFHVSSFLIITFMFPPHSFSGKIVWDRFIRYLVPFIIFVAILSPIWWWGYAVTFMSASEHFEYTLKALFYGTAPLVKGATGFSLIWFLPTLFLLTVVRLWYYWVRPEYAKFILLAMVAGILFLSWDWIRINFMMYGYPIVLYIFPLAIIGINFADYLLRVRQKALLLIGLIVVLVILEGISIEAGTRLNMAFGIFQLSREPFVFLLHQVLVIAGFLTCLVASIYIDRMRIFRVLGKYSLIVYLSHSPIYQMIISISRFMGIDNSGVFWALISLLLTLLFSIGVSLIIERIALLRNLITPKDYASFKSVFSRS